MQNLNTFYTKLVGNVHKRLNFFGKLERVTYKILILFTAKKNGQNCPSFFAVLYEIFISNCHLQVEVQMNYRYFESRSRQQNRL